MTKKDVQIRLVKMIEKGEFKRFFDTINEFYLSKKLYNKLNEEWEGIQYMLSKNMIRQNQASIVFKTVFDKYEHQILSQLDLDAAKLFFEQYELAHTYEPIHKFESLEERRPPIFTIFCIIYSIGLLISLFSIPVLIGRLDSVWMIGINIVQLGLGAIHITSLWQMKRWTIPVYFLNLLIGGLTLVLENTTNPLVLLFPDEYSTFLLTAWGLLVLAYSVTLLYYYNRMD